MVRLFVGTILCQELCAHRKLWQAALSDKAESYATVCLNTCYFVHAMTGEAHELVRTCLSLYCSTCNLLARLSWSINTVLL